MDYKLEVVVVPVSDVDRAKSFYQGLGWRLDAAFRAGPGRMNGYDVIVAGRADCPRLRPGH